VGGEPAGAFNLFFTHEHEVTAADADFLATMAQLCGQALERALLVEAESLAADEDELEDEDRALLGGKKKKDRR
jgi:GAF domain-containing protein